MRVLGIDPGNDGAFAILEDRGKGLEPVACDVLPTAKTLNNKDVVDPVELTAHLVKYGPYDMLAVEQVASRPTDGHQGAFTFGRVVGRIEAVYMLHGWPYCSPTPQTWKKVIITGSGIPLHPDRAGQKAQAIALIKSLFPGVDLRRSPKSRVDHDGKAEALCLAVYAHKYLKSQLGK